MRISYLVRFTSADRMIYRSPFKATGPTRARLEKIHALSASRVFSFRSHEIAHINHLITNQLDLMRSKFRLSILRVSYLEKRQR